MPKTFWTTERIKAGFERFKSEYNRLPTALEVDGCVYLPSSRYIQRRFGGLEKLRTELGYSENHFGRGKYRSAIATRVNKRGRAAEIDLESWLRPIFGEVFVHTERMYETAGKKRIDFYVYSPDGNFGIDVFFSDTERVLQSNVNIKQQRYVDFAEALFLVSANPAFTQKQLDNFTQSKKKPFAANMQLVTMPTLLKILKKYKPYPNPLRK